MNIFTILALIFLAGFNAPAIAKETVYISNKQVKIYDQANFKSNKIGILKQNEALEVIERKDIWVHVKNEKLQGWVSRYSVSTNKPFKKKVSIFARIKNFFSNKSNRKRVNPVSTAGGVRGLSDEDEEATGKKDYQGVEQMEKVEVSDQDVDEFIENNKQ